MSQQLIKYALVYECEHCGMRMTIYSPGYLGASFGLPDEPLEPELLRESLSETLKLGDVATMCSCQDGNSAGG